ncbi:MAG: hypothetical protein WC656_06765 [Sulfurimonas sp.]|jgi:hypothetical protein
MKLSCCYKLISTNCGYYIIQRIAKEDSIYEKFVNGGVDIQAKFDELVYDMLNDGYPSITTQEANKRVSDAVDRYRNGASTCQQKLTN